MVNANLLMNFTFISFALMPMTLNADTEKKEVEATAKNVPDKQTNKNTKKYTYEPPLRGAPAVRIGGGSRGIGGSTVELVVIAPDHTGLTTKEQPKLYWYVSKNASSKLEVTLTSGQNSDPIFEEAITTSSHAGIQSIDLENTKVKLKPNLEYRWFVSIVPDANQRSNDVIASGTIKRIIPDEELNATLIEANQLNRANIYTQNSIWYDAIDELMQLDKLYPNNPEFLELRVMLLEQAGLKTVAKYIQNK